MDDYIKRDDAISYIKENQCCSCSDIGLCGNCSVLIALKLLEKVPAADVRYDTIYGYGIKDLAVFAAACRQENITESEMHDFCLNARAAVDCVMSEMDRVKKETIERYKNSFMTDMRGNGKDG